MEVNCPSNKVRHVSDTASLVRGYNGRTLNCPVPVYRVAGKSRHETQEHEGFRYILLSLINNNGGKGVYLRNLRA